MRCRESKIDLDGRCQVLSNYAAFGGHPCPSVDVPRAVDSAWSVVTGRGAAPLGVRSQGTGVSAAVAIAKPRTNLDMAGTAVVALESPPGRHA